MNRESYKQPLSFLIKSYLLNKWNHIWIERVTNNLCNFQKINFEVKDITTSIGTREAGVMVACIIKIA